MKVTITKKGINRQVSRGAAMLEERGEKLSRTAIRDLFALCLHQKNWSTLMGCLDQESPEAPKVAEESPLKPYLCTLKETNGEYEYIHKFTIETAGDPDDIVERIAANWYGPHDGLSSEESEEDEDGHDDAEADMIEDEEFTPEDCYYFNLGAVAVEVKSVRPIDRATYEALDGIVTRF